MSRSLTRRAVWFLFKFCLPPRRFCSKQEETTNHTSTVAHFQLMFLSAPRREGRAGFVEVSKMWFPRHKFLVCVVRLQNLWMFSALTRGEADGPCLLVLAGIRPDSGNRWSLGGNRGHLPDLLSIPSDGQKLWSETYAGKIKISRQGVKGLTGGQG